jgi:hypothetical protein
MTTLAESAAEAARRVRSLKESRVETARTVEPGATDLSTIVTGYRGNEEVVVLIPFDLNLEAGLIGARLAATTFACDVITLTTETFGQPNQRTADGVNPVTGEGWKAGEMAKLVETHQALEKGWLVESLVTLAANRAGDLTSLSQNYKVIRKPHRSGTAHQVIWLGEPLPQDPSGPVADTLVRWMNAPTVETVGGVIPGFQAALDKATKGMSEVQIRAHKDCAAVEMLRILGFEGAAMLSSSSAERGQVIKKLLGKQLYRPGKS